MKQFGNIARSCKKVRAQQHVLRGIRKFPRCKVEKARAEYRAAYGKHMTSGSHPRVELQPEIKEGVATQLKLQRSASHGLIFDTRRAGR